MREPVGLELAAIMAKAPRPGLSKTRLIPALGPAGAAALATAMLRDTVGTCTAVNAERPGLRVAISYAPADGQDELRALAPEVSTFVVQRGETLGERLTAAFDDLFSTGAARILVIGADSPTLPPEIIPRAFDRLERGCDAVIGPTRDGGYYLIGLNRPTRELFADIPWSTERVLAVTLDRAATAGLNVELLPEWYDIDEPADIGNLEAIFASGYSGARATRAFLESLRP